MEFNATFIVAFISFIAFILIMNKILYKPIGDIVQKRNDFIDENYNEAKQNATTSEALLNERDEKLKSARLSLKDKTSIKKKEAQEKQNKITEEAKAQAKTEQESSFCSLEKAKDETIDALEEEIANLAQIISDKFLDANEKINKDENQELIKAIMEN